MSTPSKLYEESGKIKVSIRAGSRFEKAAKEAEKDPEKFWAEQARNLVWSKEWEKV
ncbi:MAG TPA: acetyl-coenzyme A synthetase N-terminal domain-containing protein, partial [Nitrososphaera sp.]